MSGADAPFECWAVIRPGQRGLSRAAAEAAAGEGDRVVHLVEFEPFLDFAREVHRLVGDTDGYDDKLAEAMTRVGLLAEHRAPDGEKVYRLITRESIEGSRT